MSPLLPEEWKDPGSIGAKVMPAKVPVATDGEGDAVGEGEDIGLETLAMSGFPIGVASVAAVTLADPRGTTPAAKAGWNVAGAVPTCVKSASRFSDRIDALRLFKAASAFAGVRNILEDDEVIRECRKASFRGVEIFAAGLEGVERLPLAREGDIVKCLILLARASTSDCF